MKRWHHKKKSYVDVWPAIKREGLKPMGRNHIHFVPHEA
jgi:RNA:NAD 2'-phosphotransferase (TPT1/KptA family)